MRLTLAAIVVLGLVLSVAQRADSQTTTDQYGDSTTFDPGGYYYLASPVRLNGDSLFQFELTTVEYYYNGALHYDRPRHIAPRAIVSIGNGQRPWSTYSCRVLAVRPERLSLECDLPHGLLVLDGIFLDKRGRYWNIDAYEVEPRVLVKGRLAWRSPRSAPTEHDIELLYSAGH